MSGQRIVEGIFAINKPPGKTSAQVLRDLQSAFNRSALFAPWLAEQRARRELESRFQQRRRRRNHARVEVKLGHGGTLDPMATGVLIVGVGRGTKSLSNFLSCTKTYETTALFGAMSDTYDITGRLLGRAPTEPNVTRAGAEEALAEKFSGEIMQRPPLYSALRVQGKRLYEYAREGKEPPVDIKERPVRVDEVKVLEWFEPGAHEFLLPQEEAEREEKVVAAKIFDADLLPEDVGQGNDASILGAKRKHPVEPDGVEGEAAQPPSKKIATEDASDDLKNPQNPVSTPTAAQEPEPVAVTSTEVKSGTDENLCSKVDPADTTTDGLGHQVPAAKITVTSSSGFYVRSLCHDLGRALGSFGLMATLVRTRQGQFELGRNVLEYDDISKGEEEWGPKVDAMLTEWTAEQEKLKT